LPKSVFKLYETERKKVFRKTNLKIAAEISRFLKRETKPEAEQVRLLC
jgi:hypothetical protein